MRCESTTPRRSRTVRAATASCTPADTTRTRRWPWRPRWRSGIAATSLPAEISWRAIFQPAEEVGEGAFEMIAAGAMENVRAVVALHVDPDTAAGRIAYRHGRSHRVLPGAAGRDQGQGGHAARPHQSVDPIGVASQFITSVYQFVPRSVDSRDPVVVTFGSIQGGTSANVIPEQVLLKGTIRTLSEAAAAQVGERIWPDRPRPLGGQRGDDRRSRSAAAPTPWSTIRT